MHGDAMTRRLITAGDAYDAALEAREPVRHRQHAPIETEPHSPPAWCASTMPAELARDFEYSSDLVQRVKREQEDDKRDRLVQRCIWCLVGFVAIGCYFRWLA